MKKSTILILLMALIFTSCKNNKSQNEVLSTQWMNDIQLNDGKKWDANIETTEGVLKMQDILKAQNTATIEDYHELANQLNEVKNKMVKECTMEGASHDNLHIWLYPLIEKVSALAKANTLDEASALKNSIVDNLNAYSTYFK